MTDLLYAKKQTTSRPFETLTKSFITKPLTIIPLHVPQGQASAKPQVNAPYRR